MNGIFPFFIIGVNGWIQDKIVDGPFEYDNGSKGTDKQRYKPDISFLQQEKRDQYINQEVGVQDVDRKGSQENLEYFKIVLTPDAINECKEAYNEDPEKKV